MMGISRVEAPLIWALKRQGDIKSQMVSLGRPGLFMSRTQLNAFLAGTGLTWNATDIQEIMGSSFAEPFLERVGIDSLSTIDYSDYQGANIIHDMNLPVPEKLCGISDFIFAGGTIEHIFDIRTLMHNITRMLNVGGSIALSTTQNGYGGHGFYQFSPEFFYRYFESNGYEDIRVYVVGTSHPPRWYYVHDPRVLGRRVEFVTMEPTLVLAIARKAKNLPADVVPQQSDYEDGSWKETTDEFSSRLASIQRSRSSLFAKLQDRGAKALGVSMRYLTGAGMPGLHGNPAFSAIDPYKAERL